jgi:hypothetical protein
MLKLEKIKHKNELVCFWKEVETNKFIADLVKDAASTQRNNSTSNLR